VEALALRDSATSSESLCPRLVRGLVYGQKDRELGEVIEDADLGARLIIQTALEAEVDASLCRARYQHSAGVEDARPGMRNSYGPAKVKTTARPVTIQRPKLRARPRRSRRSCSARRSPSPVRWSRW